MSHIFTITAKIHDATVVAAACRRLHLPDPVQGTAQLYSGEATGLLVQFPGWEYPSVIDTLTGTIRYGLAWHPDGRRLATGCDDRKIHVWDVKTAVEVMPPWTGHTNIGIALAFNHAGDRLVSGDWNGQTRLWDARTGRLLITLASSAGIQFTPHDRLLGYQREGKKLRLFEVAAGNELRVLRRLQADSAEQILDSAIDPAGRVLAFSSSEWLTFMDLERSEQARSIRLAGNEIARLRALPAGGCLTDGKAGVLHWPVRAVASEPTATLCIGPPRRVGPASAPGGVASLDGRMLAVPQREGAIVLDWNMPGRQVVVGPQNDVRRCALSPDGRWVVTCSFWPDGRYLPIRIWDARTGEHVHDLSGDSYITTALFSPDGRWLATGVTGDIRLWEAASWRPAVRFPGTSVVFSNDGRLLAVNDVLGAIRLVETGTWKEVVQLTGPEPTWYAPTGFSADGTRLVAIPTDRHAVYVWDLRQVREALRELDLDWDWPAFGPPSAPSLPFAVHVDLGLLGPVFENDREAVAVFTLALAFQPLNAEAYYQRGLAYRRLGETRKAMADYGCFLSAIFPTMINNGNRSSFHDSLSAHSCRPSYHDAIQTVSERNLVAVLILTPRSLNGLLINDWPDSSCRRTPCSSLSIFRSTRAGSWRFHMPLKPRQSIKATTPGLRLMCGLAESRFCIAALKTLSRRNAC